MLFPREEEEKRRQQVTLVPSVMIRSPAGPNTGLKAIWTRLEVSLTIEDLHSAWKGPLRLTLLFMSCYEGAVGGGRTQTAMS